MRGIASLLVAIAIGGVLPVRTAAQNFPVEDPVLRRIWQLGMNESQYAKIAQALMDSVGPRLTGAPGHKAAHDWAVKTYQSWGITARNEQYGTWTGWRRGITHIDLIAPRVRTLVGTVPAWSGPTRGPVEGAVLVLPKVASAAEFDAWLPRARGAFVATQQALISCRPDRHYEEFGTPGALERLQAEQNTVNQAFTAQRITPTGMSANELRVRLQDAGALGVLQSSWRSDGVQGILSANAQLRRIPTLDLACEDYGLLFRLAENNQGPRLRVNVDVEFLPDAPTYNTIAEMKGTQLPNEYVLLSSHFDSWDGASGATDNGTGTVVMMEAMRILKQVYPNPKRTIISGHWSGEEQGLNGSEAWRSDHPEVVQGMQALFNQDNGTGRVQNISNQGLLAAGEYLARWLTKLPSEITQHIRLNVSGSPGSGGTDSSSFICAGAPAFGLSSISWAYNPVTHHTNVDTYDKIVLEEVKNNATLTAMLVYLAAEEPTKMPRDRRTLGSRGGGGRRGGGGGGRGGGAAETPPQAEAQPAIQWPSCQEAQRAAPSPAGPRGGRGGGSN
jgi:hypothetical protein